MSAAAMTRTLTTATPNLSPADMNPLVFLDIDDVLCLSDPYGGFDAIAVVEGQHVNPAAVYRELFVASASQALKRVHDEMQGRVSYVISSTWREWFSRPQLESVFRSAGLGFLADRLVDGAQWRTPSKLGRGQRVDEIGHWLRAHHRGEPFVIIDDMYSGASLAAAQCCPAHPFAGRIVLCAENVGLTDDHVQPIVDALRRGTGAAGEEGTAATRIREA